MAAGFDKLGWLTRCLRGADDLTPADFRLVTVLYTYASSKDGGSIRPGMRRLVEDSCLSEKQVKRSLKKIQELGYLILVERGGNQVRKGWANVYRLGYPTRVYEESTRGDSSTPLQAERHPQGGNSSPEGGNSCPSRGELLSIKGGSEDPPIQSYTQTVQPGIDRFTAVAGLEDGGECPAGLSRDQRAQIIAAMCHVAAVEADPSSSAEDLHAAADEYTGLLMENLGPGYEELLDSHGYADVPAHIRDNPYEAGRRLNTILNAGHRNQGAA